jgi:hypothetical protein
MSLSAIYQELHRRARETGEDRAQTLTGGARIAVRVQEGIVTLTISRPKRHVGATELEVFKRDCGVPAEAVRFPQEDQNTRTVGDVTWFYVAYRWSDDG